VAAQSELLSGELQPASQAQSLESGTLLWLILSPAPNPFPEGAEE